MWYRLRRLRRIRIRPARLRRDRRRSSRRHFSRRAGATYALAFAPVELAMSARVVERQTRQFEGLVVAIPCGFKSRPAHQATKAPFAFSGIPKSCRAIVVSVVAP